MSNTTLPNKMCGGFVLLRSVEYGGKIYEVSDDGLVFRDGQQIKSYHNHDGYEVVSLRSDQSANSWRSVGVHRLMALAFLPNDDPEHKCEVNHKNYIRDDNRLENLEWISHADNVRYSRCHKPDYSGEKNPNFGNRKLSKVYSEDKGLAKAKQSRAGLRNGRCRRIDMYRDGQLVESFDYIVLCCQYLIDQGYTRATDPEHVRSQITRAIRNNTTYKGFTFVKP